MEGFSSCCNRLTAAGLVKRSQNPFFGVSCKCFTVVILWYLSWAFGGEKSFFKTLLIVDPRQKDDKAFQTMVPTFSPGSSLLLINIRMNLHA